MSGFELLHPVLQYHIVNSLGWKSLRPFQEEVIPEILSGKHLVVVAPTAGGKTEAAFFSCCVANTEGAVVRAEHSLRLPAEGSVKQSGRSTAAL